MMRSDYLTAAALFSALCVLILGAMFTYSGSVLPSSDGMTAGEKVLMWLAWGGLVAFPLLTVGWAFALRGKR